MWKKKCDDLGVTELERFKMLGGENASLKGIVADLTWDKQILKDVVQKTLKAVKRRRLAAWRQTRFQVNVRRSCRLALIHPSTWYFKSKARDQSALRIREIAVDRPRFGYLRLLVMPKRYGWDVGKRCVHSLNRLEGSQPRVKAKRRKRISQQRERPVPATGPNQKWSKDLVRNQMLDGRAFLTV